MDGTCSNYWDLRSKYLFSAFSVRCKKFSAMRLVIVGVASAYETAPE
jgi:hypothetical protein